MIINDYHIHSRLSHDTETDPDDYPPRAMELGLSAIGFSEHKDFDPNDPMRDYFDYAKCLATVEELRGRYPTLHISLGIEIDYRSWLEEEIRDFLRQNRFDYAIGSVHYIVDYRPLEEQAQGREQHEVYESYFREVLACARSGLFNVLGHADYIKRVGEPCYGPYRPDDYAPLLQEIMQAAVDNSLALEINTKALRSGLAEPYPGREMVKLFADSGGRLVAPASDAHGPDELCFAFDAVGKQVKDMGLDLWNPK